MSGGNPFDLLFAGVMMFENGEIRELEPNDEQKNYINNMGNIILNTLREIMDSMPICCENCKNKKINSIMELFKKVECFNKNHTCSICLEVLNGDDIIKTECKHFFHYDCLKEMITYNVNNNNNKFCCPNCRSSFKRKRTD